MRSRKALIAVILLLLIVPGGILLGLAGAFSSQNVSFVPATSNLSAGQAIPSFGFGGEAVNAGAVSGPSNVPIGATTEVSTATSTFSTTVAAGNQVNIAIQGNSQPQTGAALASLSTSANSSRDIEFFTNVTLQASSASSTFTEASAIAYSVGGYLAYSTETNSSALVEMRVPAVSYQEALTQVEALGTLVSLRSSSNDVTVQYTDLNATMQSLEAEQSSLLKILGQSTNINATLNVESRIQGVDEQINSVQSEILQTRTLVSYATISALIVEKAPAQPLSIKVTATPKSGVAPLSVTFNAVIRGGELPYIVNYNFGDGSSYNGQSLIHTFQQAGHYNVTVTATDASANATEGWVVVNVSAPSVTSAFGGFPSFVGGLFLQVVEGIVEVAVVVIPIAAALLLVVFPLRHRLGLSKPQASGGEAAGNSAEAPSK